jgi:hypothetical protein
MSKPRHKAKISEITEAPILPLFSKYNQEANGAASQSIATKAPMADAISA